MELFYNKKYLISGQQMWNVTGEFLNCYRDSKYVVAKYCTNSYVLLYSNVIVVVVVCINFYSLSLSMLFCICPYLNKQINYSKFENN